MFMIVALDEKKFISKQEKIDHMFELYNDIKGKYDCKNNKSYISFNSINFIFFKRNYFRHLHLDNFNPIDFEIRKINLE